MNVLGIDPGLTGGIILLGEDRKVIWREVMPVREKDLDTRGFLTLLLEAKQVGDVHVYVERIKSYGMNPTSAFTFGRMVGAIEVLLRMSQLPVTYIEADKWMKEMFQGIDAGYKPKVKAAIAFERLFPGVDLRESPRSKKPHDGLIDALLIAEYGRRKMGNA